MESKQSFWGTMYVICDKCEDVCAIFECKKVWSNDHKERYPKYVCDTCRNALQEINELPKEHAI
jgi:protein-arginine kinase activator protein McsA